MTDSDRIRDRWWSSCVETLDSLRIHYNVTDNSVSRHWRSLTFDAEGLSDWNGKFHPYDTPEAAIALSTFITA